MRFNAQVTVKNTNFGHFKFEDSTITLAYKGVPAGMASIANSRARARYTKKMNVTIDVASDNVLSNSNLSHWSEFWVFDTDQPGQIEWEGAADEDSEEEEIRTNELHYQYWFSEKGHPRFKMQIKINSIPKWSEFGCLCMYFSFQNWNSVITKSSRKSVRNRQSYWPTNSCLTS